MASKPRRLTFVNNPVPGVDQIPIIRTHPFLEATDFRTGSTFLIYEQEYAAPVRADGLCSREFILQETTVDQKIILEGYETGDQAIEVLQARRNSKVHLTIFTELVTRIGRGISDAAISRA